MENMEELEIDIDDIGTILKSSRLKSKKSMEEISSELCIRKIYLTALEEGDYETLPPIPYGIGYVRTYAKYLGLNPERAVKLYKAASQTEEKFVEEESIAPEVTKSNSWHIVAGVIAIIVLYSAWSWYSSLNTPIKEMPKEEIVAIEKVPAAIAVEAIETKENALETTQIVDETEEKTLPTEVEEVLQEETVKDTVVIENNKVVVEFMGETWAELKDKKKVYFGGIFHKGDKKEIEYTDNMFLSVGRPRNVKVYIKGLEKNIIVKRRKSNIPLDSLE